MQHLTSAGYADDGWTCIGLDEPLPNGDAIVPLARWRAEQPFAHPARIGVVVSCVPEPEFDTIDFDRFALVAVEFSPFTDGRGYSVARMLRLRGYRGDIRALGEIERDQAFFLMRCGFSSLAVRSRTAALEIAEGLAAFKHVYQPSADGSITVRELRRARLGRE